MSLRSLMAAAGVGVRPDDMLGEPPKLGHGFGERERWIIFGVIAALAILLFVWAFFIRKPKRPDRGSRVLVENSSRGEGEDSGRRRHRKRRPEHPDNLPRNPTLSETGGLPPLRDEEPDAPPNPPSSP